ncbi:hypothetical protein ABK040_003390 [Willaertia magna]
MSTDQDWIFESLVQFLQSPLWLNPIQGFIDENCLVFDGEEEHKLEHTVIHENFRKLIEQLLDFHLKEMEISHEQFIKCCMESKNNEVLGLALSHILAMDDFLSFKKMMGKRNLQIEFEAIKEMRDKYLNIPSAPLEKETPLTEDQELQKVIEWSKMEHEKEMKKKEVLEKELLNRAIGESLNHKAVPNHKSLMEDAELELALALSLSLEEERKRREAENASKELEKTKLKEVHKENDNNVVTETKVENKIEEEQFDKIEELKFEETRIEPEATEELQQTNEEKKEADTKEEEIKEEEEKSIEESTEQTSTPTPITIEKNETPIDSKPLEEFNFGFSSEESEDEKRRRQREKELLQKLIEEKEKQKEMELRKVSQQVKKEENVEMKQAKEKLVERKKKEREEKLKEFKLQLEQKKINPKEQPVTLPSMISTPTTPSKSSDDEIERRRQMSEALARKVKEDLLKKVAPPIHPQPKLKQQDANPSENNNDHLRALLSNVVMNLKNDTDDDFKYSEN